MYDYKARWYDPSIMMFTSPDTMIPDQYNPLDWNRYQYARGNPINYTDPSGHTPKELEEDDPEKTLCDYIPSLCKGGRWNPFNYDTLGVAPEISLKLAGGAEWSPIVYFDWKPIRDLNFNEGGGIGIFSNTEFTAGTSVEIVAGGKVIGADGRPLNQLGVSENGNVSGCVLSSCFGVGGSYDPVDRSFDSVEYTYGAGKGVDISVGTSFTDVVIYYDTKYQVLVIRNPFVPITGIGPISPVIVIPVNSIGVKP